MEPFFVRCLSMYLGLLDTWRWIQNNKPLHLVAPGPDGIPPSDYYRYAHEQLLDAAISICAGTYKFGARRAALVPKKYSDGLRTVHVFSLADKIVDRWFSQILRQQLRPWLHGTEPIRCIGDVYGWVSNGFVYAKRFDFKDFFTSIPVLILIRMLENVSLPQFFYPILKSYYPAFPIGF